MANFRLVAFNDKGQLVPPTELDAGLVQLLAVGTEQSYTVLDQANLDSLLSLISSQDAGLLHHHDSRYFTKIELGSTDPANTGASKIMAKNPYGGFSNVQQILEALHLDVDTLGSMVMEWQNSVLSTEILTPPLNPVVGERYLLGLSIFAEPNGVWEGFGGHIAEWTGLIWKTTSPSVGMFISADDQPGIVYYFSGTEWQQQSFESNVGVGYIDITGGQVSIKNLREKSLIVGDENNIATDVDTGLFGQIEATKDGLFAKELSLFGGAVEYPEGSGLFPDNIADQSITHGKLEGDEPGKILGFNPNGDAVALSIIGDVHFEATDVLEAKTIIQPLAVKSGMVDWGSEEGQIDDTDIPANNIPQNYTGGSTVRSELEGIDAAIGALQDKDAQQDAEDLTFLKLDGSREMTGTFNAGNQTIVNVAEIRVANIKDQLSNAAIDLSQPDALRLARKIIFTGGNKKIENLSDGTLATDAINFGQLSAVQTFLQNEIALKLDKAGDTMSGPLDMGGNFVRNLGSGILTTDAVNLGQLQNSVSTLEAADAANLQTAKDYTDAQVLIEKNRAEAAEGNLLSTINQEITDRQNAVTNEANARIAEDLTFVKLDGSRAMTGSLSMSGTNKITQLADGENPLDAVNKSQLDTVNTDLSSALSAEISNRISGDNALSGRLDILEEDPVTKAYVDAAIEGLAVKPAVKAATTEALGGVYDNASNGVGSTITLPAAETLTIDGVSSWVLFDGVLVKNETNPAFNGRYFVSQIGDETTPWILTRCGLCDEPKEITSAYVWVQGGTQNESTGWIAYVGENFTQVGVQPINWFQFSGEGTFTAGLGLQINGNQFSVKLDGTTLTVSAAGLRVNQDILDSINQEIQDRIASDASLQSQLDTALSSISSALSVLQQEDLNLNAAISSEAQARIAEDAILDAKINQEVLDREDADSALSSRLDALELDPVTKTYVDAQDASLQLSVNNLSDTVTQEVTRIDLDISNLQTTVTNNYNEQTLINASVQDQIQAEETARLELAGRVLTNEGNIENIQIDLTQAQSDISILENRADGFDASIAVIESDISSLQSQVSDNDTDIANLQSSVSSLEVSVADNSQDIIDLEQETTNINQTLVSHNSRIESLEVDPVTKTYVDNKDIALNERIDFITANTDPEALDSLSEIVAAFQEADDNINNAITLLAQTASTNLQTEIDRAIAAEAQLAADIAQEISDRIAADLVLSDRIDLTESDIDTLENYTNNIYQDLNNLDQSFIDFSTNTTNQISVINDDITNLSGRVSGLETDVTQLSADLGFVSQDLESFRIATESAIEEIEQSVEALENATSIITQDLASEISRATTAETGLGSRISALENAPQAVLSVNGVLPDLDGAVLVTTDVIQEGFVNKYYSTALFSADLALKSTTDLQEGDNLYYTQQRFDDALSLKTTTDVVEGDNLYYTDQRVQTKLGNVSGDILPDTDEAYDLGSLTNKFKDLYLSGSSIFLGGIKLSDSESGLKVENTDSGTLAINTDNIVEGSNLFYTEERVSNKVGSLVQNGTGINWIYDSENFLLTGNVDLSVFSTTDLAEGSRLYFTNSRVNESLLGAIIPNATGSVAEGDSLILALSKFVNQISVLSNIIDEEIIRATNSEDNLQNQINDLNNQVNLLEQQVGEDLQTVLQDLTSAISNEQQARELADNNLSSRIDGIENTYATLEYVNTEIDEIDSKIQYIISNTDPEALDSLSEIVDAFEAADENLEGAITNLSTNLQNQISGLDSRVSANELSITNILQSVQDLENQVGEDLQQAIANLNLAITNEEAARIAADAQVLVDANTYTDTSVSGEAFLRENADTALSERIDDAITYTDTSVAGEAFLRENADSALSTRIDDAIIYTDTSVAGEAFLRENEDNALSARIDDAITYTDTSVAGEAFLRENADSTLSSRLDILELDPVTKTYVDSLAEGISIKPSVKAATTADLNGTYENGTNGIGSTITISNEILNIDGVVDWSLFEGVLVKDQINKGENGRYFVSQIGNETDPWVLTRCGLCDEISEIPGAYVWVQGGDTLSNTGWAAYVGPDFAQVGIDDIIWYQFSGVGTLKAGLGLNLVDSEFSVKLDGTTLAVGNDGLKINDSYTQYVEGLISAETLARETADSALSSRIDTLEDQVGENLQQAIADLEAADSALSDRLAVLELDPVTKDYVDSADAAIIQNLNALDSYAQENRSLIDQEIQQRTLDVTSLGERIDAEESTRALADSTLSTRLDILELDPVTKTYVDTQDENVLGVLAGELTLVNTRIDDLETEIETNIQTAIAGVQADLTTEQAERIAADEALSARIDSVLSNLDPEAIDSFTEVVAELQTQQSNLIAVDQSLQAAIAAEEARAIAAENNIIDSLNAEITDRTNADLQLQSEIDLIESNLAQEILDRQSADTALQANIDSEESARIDADSQIINSVDALDVYAQEIRFDLDSLDVYAQEIRSDLDQEVLNRTAGDQNLQDALDAEILRATNAELNLQQQVDYITSNLDPEKLDSLTEIVDALEEETSQRISADQEIAETLQIYGAILDKITYKPENESFVVNQQVIDNGYIELGKLAAANSIIMTVDRLATHEGADFYTEVHDGVTRIIFSGLLAQGESQALEVNENIYVRYSTLLDAFAFPIELAVGVVIPAKNNYTITLSEQNVLDGYVYLPHKAIEKSVIGWSGRLALIEGFDYIVEEENELTKIIFAGESASSGSQALQAGENPDVLHFKYEYYYS